MVSLKTRQTRGVTHLATKISETSIFNVQGHSRSSMLMPLKSASPVLVMISNIYVPICNNFHAGQAN